MSKFRRMLMMANAVEPVPPTPVLPYDAEVEWIQSTGNEYIDTGIKPSTDIRLTVDGNFMDASGSNHIFGCMNTTGTITRFHIGINQSQFHAGVGTAFGRVGSLVSDTNRHEFKISGSISRGYIDSDYYTGNSTYPNLNMFLFARNTNGSAANQHPFRMYSSDVYKYSTQEKLVDYIPVRKNGVGYLYDKISGTLFGTPTGAFIYGNDVS